jgi:hypothetical protein
MRSGWWLVAMVVCACPRGPERERGVLLEYAATAPVREVVERRLARAQLSARVTDADGTLTLRLPEATDPARVERLLARRGAFVLCGEQLEDQRRWCALASAPALRARPLEADAGCVLEASGPALIEAALAQQPPPIGRVLFSAEGGVTTAHAGVDCVSPHLVTGALRAAGTSLTWDATSSRQVAQLTTGLVGSRSRLLLVFDDQVATLELREPFTGTRCEVPASSGDDQTSAERLAAVLGGELEGLTLVRRGTWGPPRLR